MSDLKYQIDKLKKELTDQSEVLKNFTALDSKEKENRLRELENHKVEEEK